LESYDDFFVVRLGEAMPSKYVRDHQVTKSIYGWLKSLPAKKSKKEPKEIDAGLQR
jgi:hypothetical protein